MIKKFLVETEKIPDKGTYNYSISFAPLKGLVDSNINTFTLVFWGDSRIEKHLIEMTCDGLKHLKQRYEILIDSNRGTKFSLYITPIEVR